MQRDLSSDWIWSKPSLIELLRRLFGVNIPQIEPHLITDPELWAWNAPSGGGRRVLGN
jgi:hypothetical protein